MTSRTWRSFKQDLTTDYPGLMGGYLRHGRCHLRQYIEAGSGMREGHEVGAEWSFFRDNSTSIAYTHDPTGDHKHMVHASLRKVFSIFLHWSPPWKPMKKEGQRLSPRKIGISAHDGIIFWEVWKDPMSWSKSDGWRNSSFNWVNFLLGKTEYHSNVLKEVETVVPMPEGNYPVKVTLKDDTWTRPHTIFGLGEVQVRRAEINVLPGPNGERFIPVPGKGENSWDLDDDGIWDMVCPARTVSDAIAAMVESAMRDRERRGGLAWKPV